MAAATSIQSQRGPRQFQGIFSEMWLVKATLDAGSLADGAGETDTIAVPGVALGDIVLGVSFGVDVVGITITGYVSAANVVTLRLQNESGAAPDLASTTIKVVVARPAF